MITHQVGPPNTENAISARLRQKISMLFEIFFQVDTSLVIFVGYPHANLLDQGD